MASVERCIRIMFFALLVTLVSTGFTGAGQAQAPAKAVEPRLAKAATIILREGAHAKLPPHISTMLKLTQEEDCPVMQGVQRTGAIVQGLDVSVLNNQDLVLFVADESTHNQSLYLTSPDGTLRRMVSVKAGVGIEMRITDKEREAFEKEKHFWMDRMAPVSAAK